MRPRLTPVLAGERFLQMWRTAGGNSDGGCRELQTGSRAAVSVNAADCERSAGMGRCRGVPTKIRTRNSADVGNCRREAGCGNDL